MRRKSICAKLAEHGVDDDWPAAIVSSGTLAGQRVVTGTLGTLAAAVARAGLESPCLTIVGEVVRLRDDLAWFDDREVREPLAILPPAA
jgi:uroporphyrin-III C-methyltransferase / precorrin-2 dehydrogenase / sirohydrochlorin ferrochelatase